MNRWYLDENDINIYLKCTDDVRWNYNPKELVRILNNLEAKLAESEKEHELLIDQFEEETENLRKQIKQESDARKRFVEEVKQLKQQLAEKEKLIEDYSAFFNQLFNQDKISFAVEQLEKVKGKIQHNILFVDCNDYVNVIEEIDNQIKAIKEME